MLDGGGGDSGQWRWGWSERTWLEEKGPAHRWSDMKGKRQSGMGGWKGGESRREKKMKG